MKISQDRHYVVVRYQLESSPYIRASYALTRWAKGRGNRPCDSHLDHDDLDRCLRFPFIDQANAHLRTGYSMSDHRIMTRSFLATLLDVMDRHGIRGQHYVGGEVYRAPKKAWEAYLKEAIFKPRDIVYAKLVGERDLMQEIWNEAGYPAR